jgi:hypothetical protein
VWWGTYFGAEVEDGGDLAGRCAFQDELGEDAERDLSPCKYGRIPRAAVRPL